MKELIVATHQPNYIPWMGYFYKISKSNIFVFLDDVQFSKTGSHNYHYIKTPNGQLRLKIPVKHKFNDPINKVITKDIGGWKEKHLASIESNYKKSPFFNDIFYDFQTKLFSDYDNLAELNIEIIKFFMNKFGITTKTVRSSELELDKNLKGENRIIEICKKLNTSIYYSGKGAKAYQSNDNFNKEGIKLIYDDYSPVIYGQLWGEFITNVSFLDYIFNNGYDWNKFLNKLNKN